MTVTRLWMVVGENGVYYTRWLVEEGLTEEAAQKRKDAFRANKSNPEHFHKVDYYMFEYTTATRSEVLTRERVQI